MKTSRKIMFLRDAQGYPVGCLAISLNKSHTQIRYQLSVLNPVDKFERSLARHIALGRLLEKPARIPCKDTDNKFVITELVMQNLLINNSVPSRAKKAAKLWLACQ